MSPFQRQLTSRLSRLFQRLSRHPHLVTLFLLIPLILRAVVISNGAIPSILFQTVVGTLLADAPLFFLLFFSLALPVTPRSRALTYSIRSLLLLLVLLYLLDLVIYMFFSNRLLLADFFKFYREGAGFFANALNLGIALLIVVALFFSLFYGAVFFSTHFSSLKKERVFRSTLILLFCLSFIAFVRHHFVPDNYIHKWEYANYISHNIDMFAEQKEYSELFIANFVELKSEEQCETVPVEKKKIILLNVESLSNFQSALFSGLMDLTPEVDRIARENRWFPTFYSNGFQTEDAKIALLTGDPPVYPPASFTRGGGTSFFGFYNSPTALPRYLNDAGYHVIFFEPCDLTFSNTANWLHSNGFDEIIGGDDSRFDGSPRFVFKSAPDSISLERAAEFVDQLNDPLYFLYIMTVTNHTPFVDPHTGVHSHDLATRYTDRAVGRFYNHLVEKNFFEEGILIIVGDHRAMVPLVPGEHQLFGERAAALVPLIIATGKREEERIEGQFQQIDLYNSIVSHVTGRRCTSPWRGELMSEQPTPAQFIFHRRGDVRTDYSIFSPKGDQRVKVNGDFTSIVPPPLLDSATNALIVNRINAMRIARQPRD